jgi:hypothetical protein
MLAGQYKLEDKLQERLLYTVMPSLEFPVDCRARRPDVRQLVRIFELAHEHTVMMGGEERRNTPCKCSRS